MALSIFQLCVVFTIGILLGSASVWAGGGEEPYTPEPGGRARAVIKGAPLKLPCPAPDPRSAAHSMRKYSNMLGNQGEDVYSDYENGDDVSFSLDDLPKRSRNDKNKKRQRLKELTNKRLDRTQSDVRRRKLRPKPEIRDDEDYEDAEGREDPSLLTYAWFHNGTEIKGNKTRRYVLPDGSLFFKKFGRISKNGLQDTGEYRCVLHASMGAVISPAINLSFASMESIFTRYPVDIEVYQGDAVLFSCEIKSSPPATISWIYESKLLVPSKRVYFLSSNTILITDITLDDVGKYRCVAKNGILKKSHSSPEGMLTVIKEERPDENISFVTDAFDNYNGTREKHVNNVTAFYGNDVILNCVVNGKPKPKVVWSFQADSSNTKVKEISSMEIYQIPEIAEDQSGVYTCVANNLYQSIKQVYHVNVFRAPYLRQSPISELSPTAKTVRFNCSVGGSPAPTLVWYRNGEPLNITGRVKLKGLDNKSPELIITDTISSDKGIYQCVAYNGVDEVSSWATLTLKAHDVPPPYNVKCLPFAPDSVRISSISSCKDIVAYTVHYVLTDGGEEQSEIHTVEQFDLKNLELYQKYDIYVKTYLKHGASDQSEHVTCRGQGAEIHLLTMTNNSILMTWKERSTIVNAWLVQWRPIKMINATISNITLPGNSNSYIIPDSLPLEKYEFRVLAITDENFLDQDLSLLPWASAKNKTVLSLDEPSKNQSHLDTLYANSPRIYQQASGITNLMKYPKPMFVDARALGPHSINVSWTCDAAEASGDFYSFLVCFTSLHSEHYPISGFMEKKSNETCQSSFNTWTVIRGLEEGTYYSFRVQAVVQNTLSGGPFSDPVGTRTNYNDKTSITDVRWKKVNDNTLQISWTHVMDTNLPEDDVLIDLSRNDNTLNTLKRSWTYTVKYSQDLSMALDQWPSKNITDNTSTEVSNLDYNKGVFVMVFVAGENQGKPLDITSAEMRRNADVIVHSSIDNNLDAQDNSEQSDDQKQWKIGLIVGLSIPLLLMFNLGLFYFWRKRKQRRQRHTDMVVQLGSRGRKSHFECQELMTQSSSVDSKGGVIYLNGLSESDGIIGSGAEESLLNGHLRITENPRFLGMKHMGNGNCRPLLGAKSLGRFDGTTFDVSRYEELPDVAVETVLETDLSGGVPEVTLHSTLPIDRKGHSSEMLVENSEFSGSSQNQIAADVADTSNFTIDRNSNSEIANIKNNFNKFVGNNVTIGDQSYSNSIKPGAKLMMDKDEQDVIMEKVLADRSGMNYKAECKCRVDALSGLRENGASKRITPVIGPNG